MRSWPRILRSFCAQVQPSRRVANHLPCGLPLLVTANPAKSMAAIRVQLVKYIVHLPDETVWPAYRAARRVDHAMSGDVSQASSHSGRLPAARSATAVTAAKMAMASGMSGGICCFMRASLSYRLRSSQPCIIARIVRPFRS